MKNYFTLFLLFATFTTFAQVAQEVPEPPFIKTVQFNASSTSGTSLPILQLGSRLSLSFDDIYGDERDYFYKITHHNAD